MKKLLLLGLTLISLYGCREKEQDPTVLPPATQEGKNTGGALVNGEVWVAEKQKLNIIGNGVPVTEYGFSNNQYYLKIYLYKSNSSIDVIVKDIDDITTKTYYLNNVNKALYTPDLWMDYITSINNIGILKITKFDKQNKIVSGIFEFDAVNDNGEVVHITKGRFDKRF
ncbi:MAG: hypothetical protein CSA38_00855 [Flavobacteriales bacterium]|nr:MAG: hypothetical protein CSA38_00855 [Flavobacteriales bacterium]